MVLLVTKVNGFPQLTFVTKCSNIDFALVLDTLLLFFITHYKLTKCDKRTSPFSKIQWQRWTKQEKTSFNKSKQSYIKTFSQNFHASSYFTFGKGRRSLSTKHKIWWFFIAGTSNRVSTEDFPSRISAAYAIAKVLRLLVFEKTEMTMSVLKYFWNFNKVHSDSSA